MDIAILLEPSHGNALAAWTIKAGAWKEALQSAVGDTPKVDLQLALPEEDEIVWPAVSAHGIVLFERDPSEPKHP